MYIDGGKMKSSQKTEPMCNSMSTNDIIIKVGILKTNTQSKPDTICQSHTFEPVNVWPYYKVLGLGLMLVLDTHTIFHEEEDKEEEDIHNII